MPNDKTIDELTDAGAIASTDQVPVMRSGQTRRVQVGTAAAKDTGTDVGEIPLLVDVGGGTAGLPAVDGSNLTGIPSGGDMTAATYDPGGVAGSAFAMENMVEAADAKVMTAAERTKLSNLLNSAVMVVSESGAATLYQAASDTDQARGAALEAAVAAHAAGDMIHVGPGVYEVDHSLVLKADVTLAGAGRHTTTIKQSWLGSAKGDPSIRAHSVIINEGFNTQTGYGASGNIECRDFTVFARSSGIGFGHCENVRIHNVHCSQVCEATENGHFFDLCAVRNFLAEGLSCKSPSYGFGIYQVDAAGVSTALQALDTDGTTELTVNADSTASEQVRFIGCQSEITGAGSDNQVHYAIHRDGHQGVLISGCQMVGGRFALDTDDGISGIRDVTMTGCQFTSTDSTALKPPIRIRSAPTAGGGSPTTRMYSVSITNNVVQYGGSYGAFFRRIDDLTFTGNVMRSTDTGAAYGALLYGCRGTITGNTIVSTNGTYVATSAGFFVDEAPTDLTSNELTISSNILVNWDRGLENQDAGADILYGPNVFKGVNEEVRAGGGSPEQVRKVPTPPPRGSIYVSSASATTITGSPTWDKVAGTTTGRNLKDWSMPANNRLQYDGVPDVYVKVTVSLTFESASSSQVVHFRVAKNGDETDADSVASEVSQKTGTGGDVEEVMLNFDALMSTGDYIELFVMNASGSNNVTVDYMNMCALAVVAA